LAEALSSCSMSKVKRKWQSMSIVTKYLLNKMGKFVYKKVMNEKFWRKNVKDF
jgi:hypothetical protein